MNVIECKELTKMYGSLRVLSDFTLSIGKNKITGLIGRNGAGKTTLLKIIAGFIRETSGDIQVFQRHPFNDLTVSANTIFVDDQMSFPTALNLAEILEVCENFYENWDSTLADGLFNYFSFHPKQRHSSLSKGKRSTFNMIVGLASRCSLTIFDEPTTGMDAATRSDFYRALLKDYIATPRTIIISSHHVEEMEDILEEILLLNNGKAYLHLPAVDVKEYAIGLQGKRENVEKWIAGRETFYEQQIGVDSVYVVVKNDFPETFAESAKVDEVALKKVTLSEICMYLTSNTKGGIDDVFRSR